MKNVILSDRLNAVAGLVKSSDCVCDIGTDHGFVPIYLINSGICKRAIAMDINKGPLDRARDHIKENGLADLIETRLSNGMEKLSEGETDAVVIAGMGGLLMKRILEDGQPRKKGIKQMVLQPQSDLRLFREYLRRERFFITKEAEVFEDGKYYVAISVNVSDDGENVSYKSATEELIRSYNADLLLETATRICDRFGPCLLLKRDETLRRYLEHEKSICEGILLKLSENEHTERINDIINKINDIIIALSLYVIH
ncbi:class I SAM-dependent methyltransferase [Butyrivibrio sp. WCE2006]|uniref:class I SAM-dependent methyltransferase n=1 Tax=Butyrivibrio sp. WCE2006 TaxID=1410611 RepID=UPI0005D26A7F|nr:class I SAM-dependent methyltransferase [Butyrivibrio sp. WCE2006]